MHNKNILSLHKHCQKCPQLLLSVAVLSSTVIVNTKAAPAITFDFSYEPGTSQQQMLGFEMAGQIWSSYLDDDITVRIHVGITDMLKDDVIGGALPRLRARQNYGEFYEQLKNDATSSDDNTAHSNLHSYGSGSSMYYEAEFETTGTWTQDKITLTRANAKAIGMVPPHRKNLDGFILMSDLSSYSDIHWNYDYTRQNDMSSNSVDFLTVAMHEIGHILGFVSGVDSTEEHSGNASQSQNSKRLDHTTSLDQFRYSGSSSRRNNLDLAYGFDSYFSIDGGQTNLANMSQGKDLLLGYGGDGYQASHWARSSHPLGIMDPDIALGERGNISDLDLRAFDVIGYNCKHFNSSSSSSGYYYYSSGYYYYSSSSSSSSSPTCDAPSLNLASLESQAQNALIGKTTASRIDDVVDMIVKSEMYEWGWSSGSSSSNSSGDGNCNPNCNSYPVELAQILATEGMFEKFSRSTIQLEAEEVPEPRLKLGLLGLSLWASSSLLKRSRKYN